jgi:serine protease AprX
MGRPDVLLFNARLPRGTTLIRAVPLRLGAAVLAAIALMVAVPVRPPTGPLVGVVVRAVPGTLSAVERTVVDLGGKVEEPLGIINGFLARIDGQAVADLRTSTDVVSVTANTPLHLLGTTYDAGQDKYSLFNDESYIGNRSAWNSHWTGAGIDVALIDSGISPVPGLANPGQVVYGPDLTEESQNPSLANLDTFGHGTFMASIIAGHDAGVKPSAADSGSFMGIAPDAGLVSVKVADARGVTDVSQVIAGIGWVVQHAHDPGLNIRVLNLSFGTDSTQSYRVDPLAFAAEVAWRSGVVVVTSAGNDGPTADGLTMPAADPRLIAVGAVDMNGQASAAKATVAPFSSNGDGVRNPDLLAPGVHVQGLRDPGSYIDATYASTGAINDRFFRGSGTSEAAAFVSGSVAQLLQQRPWMTPDQVKALLIATANPLPCSVSVRAQGAGIIDMLDAVAAKSVPTGTQNFAPATGAGTLEGTRGSAHPVLRGVPLTGEQDIFGHRFDSAAMAAAEAAGHTWSGGDWNGSTWTGSGWSNGNWTGHTWSTNDWTGHTWSSANWANATWTGSSWANATWTGSGWTGMTWSAADWASAVWANYSWS